MGPDAAACRTDAEVLLLVQGHSRAHQALVELATAPAPLRVVSSTPHAPGRERVRIDRAPGYRRGGLLGGIASWLAFTLACVPACLSVARDGLVVAMTNPPLLPHLVWLAHRLRGLDYAIVVWDLFPRALVQAGHFRAGSLAERAWSALNRRCWRDARVVVCLGERMARLVREEASSAAVRTVVVPNCVDTEAIRPVPKEGNPFAIRHGQVGRLTVLYSGNFGGTHGLEMLPRLAAALCDDERFWFLLIGEGRGRAALEAEAERLRVRNVTTLPYQPWDVLPSSLACGDVAVVAQAPGTELNSFPSKVYSSLGAGSAILAITSRDSDLADLVTEHDCGVSVAWGDVEGAAAALRALADDPRRLARLRANARAAAEQYYDLRVVARRLREALCPAREAAS